MTLEESITNSAVAGGNSGLGLFPRLPPELRLRIWELTWPDERVIEPARRTWKDPHYLRPTGTVSSWIEEDFSVRIPTTEPLEPCPNPVALQVCRESRIHTLRRYVPIRHGRLETATSYMDPRSDFLWLSHDFDLEILDDLRSVYGHGLTCVTRVLVEELGIWADEDVERVVTLLQAFERLQLIRVILEEYSFSEEDQSIATPDEYLETAEKLLARDSPLLQRHSWRVEYTDRDGNIYGYFEPI